MNPYKNLLLKVRALLKEDDHLTKEQCEVHQWQLLAKLHDYTFIVGKGGVNTIFFSASSEERSVCYPDEILDLLKKLSEGEVLAYVALDKKKEQLGYSVLLDQARAIKRARFLGVVNFKGKMTIIESKAADLHGKKTWYALTKKKKAK